MPCTHNTCRLIHDAIRVQKNGVYDPSKTGAIVIGLCNYYGKSPVVAFGLESGGRNRGMYNALGESPEPSDNCCLLSIAKRCLFEEFSLTVNTWSDLDRYLRPNGSPIQWFLHYSTPVFVANFNGISRRPLNAIIAQKFSNRALPFHLREIECINYFQISDGNSVDGTVRSAPLSPLALACIRKIRDGIKDGSIHVY